MYKSVNLGIGRFTNTTSLASLTREKKLLIKFNITYFILVALFKGIDRSFELRGESRLNRFVMTNWRLGNFFYFTLKGFHHKISKKPKDAA